MGQWWGRQRHSGCEEAVEGHLGKQESFQSLQQENLASQRGALDGESETRVWSWTCT